ncbi:PREDICTED: uncharacterized protein LOC108663621 [Theobroma cacao]|uniref:Uncharacterized protein LOC108663621 n=1 Tax=Theobroma cacao TaxID=3641 RepID=A0AB32X092_THECC|nr:PREDICTED: uncharacterized protein LOC108663621 [Theobroma cacao]
MKGVIRFTKRGKLNSRYIGPFRIIERIGPVAYRLELRLKLDWIHNVFHVSMLKKYVLDPSHIVETPPIELHEDLKFEVQLEYSTFKNRSYSASSVKEFYASIALGEEELDDSDDYIENGPNVFLNGKEFVVTTDDLGNLLKVECEEGEFEFPKKYNASSLWEIITGRKEKYSSKSNVGLITSTQIRILHYFVAANIHGRSGSLSYISLQDLWLMEHAFSGVALNVV